MFWGKISSEEKIQLAAQIIQNKETISSDSCIVYAWGDSKSVLLQMA